MSVFSRQYDKIFVLDPFWRSGSTLVSAVISHIHGMQNLDEVFDCHHPWDSPYLLKDFSSGHTYGWQSVGSYNEIYPKFIESMDIDTPHQFMKLGINIDRNYLLNPDHKCVIKVVGEQCSAFRKIFNDMELTAGHNYGFALLWRKDFMSSIVSSSAARITGVSHSTDNEMFLKCFRSKKEMHITDIESDQVFYLACNIYNFLLPYSIEQINLELKRLERLKIRFDDFLIYEDFDQHPIMKQHLSPYRKDKMYFDILDRLNQALGLKTLEFVDNQFTIRSLK